MLRIFLVRHGETKANKELRYQGSTDIPLSEVGRTQAARLQVLLKNVSFDRIYSSNLIRSIETAQIITSAKSPEEIIKLPELTERNFGAWENQIYPEIKASYPKIYAAWLKDPTKAVIPKAEPLNKMQTRIRQALQKIESATVPEKDETVLIVGHGGTNRIILAHYLNTPLNSFWRIKQENCCLNIIEINKDQQTVSLLNYTENALTAKSFRY